MQRSVRMKKEVQMLDQSPPHGISCWVKEDNFDRLEAQIIGGDGTPYEGGIFNIEIQIPERYPFEPPKMKFITPIYHPNIDTAGRICLDTLKMPPKGAWKPCLNVSTVLTSIQLLMMDPNPEDPLMTDVSNEFKYNRVTFNQKAREWTKQHAMQTITENKNGEAGGDMTRQDGAGSETSSSRQSKVFAVPDHTHQQTLGDITNKRLKTS